MIMDVNLTLILLASLVAVASPGPSTMAIAGTSMGSGRVAGLTLASGIMIGSFFWSISAALGLSAVMMAHAWLFEVMRYAGTAYLLFLAYKSAKSALSPKQMQPRAVAGNRKTVFLRGVALHITNPKAILFFGSLYALGMPANATAQQLGLVIAAVGLQSALVFHGYALLFSTPAMTRKYINLRRWFEGAFAIGFGLAGFKILTARL